MSEDYTEFSTKLEINIKGLMDALRAKDLKKALVEGCTAMNNLHQILRWIYINDKE